MIRLSRMPPASATMLVRPPFTAVTRPAGLTLATLLSRLDQMIVADATGWPCASRATALTASESLTYTRPLSRDTSTDVTRWPASVGPRHTVARHASTRKTAFRILARTATKSRFMEPRRLRKLGQFNDGECMDPLSGKACACGFKRLLGGKCAATRCPYG